MPTVYLKRGDTGEEVRLLQKGLAIFGKTVNNITAFDNSFGPGTELALKRFQAENALATTGVYDQDTKDLLGPEIDDMFIRLADMNDYAKDISVEPAALKAVYTVESKGDGFYPSGRCVILFEGHIFYRLYERKYGTTKVQSLARQYPSLVYKSWTSKYYYGGDREHQRLEAAKRIDANIAIQSTSWGLFQVMGFNYATAGFNSPEDYVDAMNDSEFEQFNAGCAFISSNKSMLSALQSKNWPAFAKLYNGPAYAQNSYDSKLNRAYNNYRSL